jgi:Domain of unknown function (DUF4180)
MPAKLPDKIFFVDPKGAALSSERDATDVIGDAMGANATIAAVPVARLDPAFLDLSSGLAGAFLQKFATYGMRVALVGDIEAQTAHSSALAAFVRESNAGAHVWFVADLKALATRLARG